MNEENSFILTVKDFQNGNKSYEELIRTIQTLRDQTKDSTIQEYINDVLQLAKTVGGKFFNNIRFDLGCDEIINKCKAAITAKMVNKNKIDELFRNLDSTLRKKIFLQKNEKTLITFEEFHQKYSQYFQIAREEMKEYEFNGDLPENLNEQIFIQQLMDIETVDESEMIDYTRYKLQMQNNIHQWMAEGCLAKSEFDQFKKDAITKWRNHFKYYSEDCVGKEIPEPGKNILYETRKVTLSIASQNLSTYMSNGQYYILSDHPEIGWCRNWEKKYK